MTPEQEASDDQDRESYEPEIAEHLAEAMYSPGGGQIEERPAGLNDFDRRAIAAMTELGEVNRRSLADGVALKDAVSNGIFAINTLLHPDATSDEDFAAFEAQAEATLTALVGLREALWGSETATPGG